MKPISVEYSKERLIDATEDNLDISVQIYYGLHTGQNQLCVKRRSCHLRYLCVMNRFIITDGFRFVQSCFFVVMIIKKWPLLSSELSSPSAFTKRTSMKSNILDDAPYFWILLKVHSRLIVHADRNVVVNSIDRYVSCYINMFIALTMKL